MVEIFGEGAGREVAQDLENWGCGGCVRRMCH